jgi:low temperature requirement protein LtrA
MSAASGAEAGSEERRTTPVELLWDLVFVYAVTQVTALLASDLSWSGLLHSMLILALVWWAWSAFVWAANAQAEDSATMRVALLGSLVLIFVAGLAIPGAFDGKGPLFAITYAGVRLVHLALYADASRKGNASWEAIAGFGAAVIAGMALLIAGSFLDGATRVALWTAAVAIDYAGPAWLTRERLRGLQDVAVAHFAERYGLFIIICLGESIIAIGLAANHRALGAELIATVVFGVLITIGLWWTYFGVVAEDAEHSLRRKNRDTVLAAADGYSYMHLLLVAGITIFAVGIRFAVEDLGDPLSAAARLALCGGVALYLLGHVAFGLRMSGDLGIEELIAAAATLLLFAFGAALGAWTLVAVEAAIIALLCAAESGSVLLGHVGRLTS